MAVEIGRQAQVKRLFLTHHHNRHDDAFLREMEKEAQAVFPQARLAREGMTVEV
jgi:ribonuclease BN (tRNA processing enzyme)